MKREEILSKIKNEYGARQKTLEFKTFCSFLPTIKFIQTSINQSYSFFESECKRFSITSGHLDGKSYVDSVKDMTVKQNSYNHFVNAFAYWDLLTDEGKVFFMELYRAQFEKLLNDEVNRHSDYLRRSDLALKNHKHIYETYRSLLS